jgi:penicillin-binding protein 2
MEGELYTNETIDDGGRFMLVTQVKEQAPKCWVSEGQRYTHQNQTIVQGLSNSCNFFFYTLGHRLGETRMYQYAAEFGLTSKTGVELPGEERSVVGNQTSLYDPDKPMDESSQDTAVPIIVFNSIKRHLRNQGASRNITYDEERLNRCVKRLMDMAVNTNQGDWVVSMRPILMEELNMSREMVYLQVVIGDTYNYLNDIKWGGGQTIQVAIGQSITVVTPAAVSRYVAALGNGGKVYNLMLVDSITSPEGDIISERNPVLIHDFNDDSPDTPTYLAYILQGMKGVVDDSGTAEKYFRGWAYSNSICAKTGTAEVTTIDLENNAWFVCLAPYDSEGYEESGVPVTTVQPEIAVVVFIPSGFSGGEASMAAREFIGWYMDQKTLRTTDVIFPAGNTLAP